MKWLWWLGGALAVPALWLGGPLVARQVDFFRVRRVEFAGLRYGSPEAALARLALPRTLNLFEDLAAVEKRANAIPGVRSAQVSRRLPGTLVVTLQERVPVALVPSGGSLRLMDAGGKVLPFDPARSAPDLPVAATAAPQIGRLLASVRRLDPALFGKVTAAGLRGTDVALTVEGRQFIFRPDASIEEMRAVTLVASDLTARGQAFDELDGRFAGCVVVRGGA
ncbi:MAG TPA: FtsQ-type POTRA domain-containing protein [Gemmatimonadales bacterium]|nr:FtsQ-type POTRA domain-containing protein [Gemmatimonadales bacterium]